MAELEVLKARVQKLSERVWDVPTIEARYRKIMAMDIPRKTLDCDEILDTKQQILARIQMRAEEYEYLSHN